MNKQILIVAILTFIINLISTLSYSVRIAGVRTGKIAISLSLFNILVLCSRTSNSIQAPLLAKHIENNIQLRLFSNAEYEFRLLLLSTTLATIIGIILTPTFQRVFGKGVQLFSEYRSIPKLVINSASYRGISYVKNSIKLPSFDYLNQFSNLQNIPISIVIFNTIATAIITVGVLASLYAGYLTPDLRVTANSLSPIINGFATILMFIFIDPSLSLMTDDVIEGKVSESVFRKYVVLLLGSRLIGTIIAQFLFIPSAKIISKVASFI